MKNWLFLPLILIISNVSGQRLDRFAFGSCSFQFGKQKIWKRVVHKDPQLWIWLGDIIYNDVGGMGKTMSERYAQADANPNYNLLKQQCPVIATWDDHDFGGNNVGGEYPLKKESKEIFLDFLGASEDDPRWNRDGIYTSYTYGSGAQQVHIILLDTRYNREAEGPENDMLGENQWKWLEEELKSSEAKITIIGSSIQFVATVPEFENWDKFPRSQDRLLRLIDETDKKGVVFISGDVHFAEVSKRKYDQVSYPIYDLTSSGLTHGNNVQGTKKNPYRIPGSRYGRHNFGFVAFDWEAEKLLFTAFGQRGKERSTQEIPFSELGY